MVARRLAIDPTHELLDSQSTIDGFSNRKLLRHIQRVPHYITAYSNAGSSRTNLFGLRDGHGWVWYDSHGIGNIYSMKLMTKRYRVMFDSEGTGVDRNAFVVHRPNCGPPRPRPRASHAARSVVRARHGTFSRCWGTRPTATTTAY